MDLWLAQWAQLRRNYLPFLSGRRRRNVEYSGYSSRRRSWRNDSHLIGISPQPTMDPHNYPDCHISQSGKWCIRVWPPTHLCLPSHYNTRYRLPAITGQSNTSSQTTLIIPRIAQDGVTLNKPNFKCNGHVIFVCWHATTWLHQRTRIHEGILTSAMSVYDQRSKSQLSIKPAPKHEPISAIELATSRSYHDLERNFVGSIQVSHPDRCWIRGSKGWEYEIKMFGIHVCTPCHELDLKIHPFTPSVFTLSIGLLKYVLKPTDRKSVV